MVLGSPFGSLLRKASHKSLQATFVVDRLRRFSSVLPQKKEKLIASLSYLGWQTGLNSLAQWCSSRHSLRSALCFAKLPPKAFAIAKLLCSNPMGSRPYFAYKKPQPLRIAILKWCSERDSNPHGFRHTPLKRTCLPIPPPERFLKPHICRYFLLVGKTFFRFFCKKIKRACRGFGKPF